MKIATLKVILMWDSEYDKYFSYIPSILASVNKVPTVTMTMFLLNSGHLPSLKGVTKFYARSNFYNTHLAEAHIHEHILSLTHIHIHTNTHALSLREREREKERERERERERGRERELSLIHISEPTRPN